MIRLSLACTFGLLVAAATAWSFGGSLGGGILAGFLLGAALCGLGAMHQAHVMRTNPSRVMQAFGLTFLIKLGALLAGALAFRYLPIVSDRIDWQGFVLAFAAAVALVLPFAVWDAVRRSAPRLEPAPTQHPEVS